MAATLTDVNTLMEDARCFACLEPGELQQVKTYLLAVIAGGSTDPNVLLEAARCFDCMEPGQLRQIQVYLLNQIANP